jgi:hypothetical protein
MMTRKDYISTAEILNKHFEEVPPALLLDFSNMFKKDNERFNEEKFFEACLEN